MEHLQDNALESELTPNEPEVLSETELEVALQSAGFSSLEDAYTQYKVSSLEELHEALEQQVTPEVTENNPILGLIRAIGRLLGIGRKSKYRRYKNRKGVERGARKMIIGNTKKAISGERQAVRGSTHTTRRRRRHRKQSQSTIPSTAVQVPIPSTKPNYNINPIPSMQPGNIPSTHPQATMEKLPVKFPPIKKTPPPFKAPLKPYNLEMLEPQGPAFTNKSQADTQTQEMARYLARDTTYKLVITIGYRLSGVALTSAQMNATKLPTGGFITGPTGKPVTPNQALQNRASFMLKQLASYITDPVLRRSILSGRSPRVIIRIDKNTVSGPPGAKIQAYR